MKHEKFCKYCEKYYTFDDGIDDALFSSDELLVRTESRCPNCIDPRAVPHETYMKKTILNLFRAYLKRRDINADVFEESDIIEMLKEFPRANDLFQSNGNFITVTLYTGMGFQMHGNDYILGPPNCIRVEYDGETKKTITDRLIQCARCAKSVIVNKMQALSYFIGFEEKYCATCDSWQRNTTGLQNGSVKSDSSQRAIAKALNISRSELRNSASRFTKPIPSLPIGTRFGLLEIKEAYWDEDPSAYAPKYTLRCVECGTEFTCLQRQVEQISHPKCFKQNGVK